MRTTEILFESRAAVLKAEAETRLLDKQIELERLRKSNDEYLIRKALEALEMYREPIIKFGLLYRHGDKAIAALRERLDDAK